VKILWRNLEFSILSGLDHLPGKLFDKGELLELAALLDSDHPLSSRERYWAAEILRQLAAKRAAINALNRTAKSTPGEIIVTMRALHYLVRTKILGRGGSNAALKSVAETWRKSVLTIKGDFTARKVEARNHLANIIRLRRDWTESRVLEALDADLTDRAKQNLVGKK
jgi:hypothetical protein